MSSTKHKVEFGDFQTPLDLAREVCALLASKGVNPAAIVEPTCGIGTFLFAALEQFRTVERVLGFDINTEYVETVQERLKQQTGRNKVQIVHGDFFIINWQKTLQTMPEPILVIGNPPWVTSAELGSLESANIPQKGNFEGLTAC